MKFFFTTLLLLSGWLGVAQMIDLSLSLEEKKAYTQRMTSKTYSKHNTNKQIIEVTAETQTDLIFNIKKRDKGIFHAEAVYSDVQMNMQTFIDGKEMPLGRVKEVINMTIPEIKKQPFEINISTKGKIMKVPVMENIFQRAIRNVVKSQQKSQPITDFQQKQTLEQLEKSFGAETLIVNLETLMNIFPRKMVEIGESWAITTFLSNGMDTKITTEYTLSQVTPEYLLVTGKANINLDNEQVILTQGQQVFFTINGGSSCEIKLDPKTKWIIEAHYTQKLKGQSRTTGDRSHPQGLIIPIDTSSEIIIKN